MNNLNFYEALQLLLITKEQIKARRAIWPKEMYVIATEDPIINKKVLEHHTKLECKDGDLVISRWSPNSNGLIADDWIIEYE